MIKIDALLPKGDNVNVCTTSDTIQKFVTGPLYGELPFKAYNSFSFDPAVGVFTADSYVDGDGQRCAQINQRFKLWKKKDSSRTLLRTSLKFYSPSEFFGRNKYIVPKRLTRCNPKRKGEKVHAALLSIDVFNHLVQKTVWFVLLRYPSDDHREQFVLGESMLSIHGT